MSLLSQLGLLAPKAVSGANVADGKRGGLAGAPANRPLRTNGSGHGAADLVSQAAPQEAELDDVLIYPTAVDITPGTPVKFRATFEYSDGTSRIATELVTWTSSDPAIKINDKGVATASAVTASAIITATDPNTGKSAMASAEVAAPKAGPSLVKITVEPAAISLVGPALVSQDGKPQQFKAVGTFADKSTKDLTASLDWSSSVPSVVSVERGSGKATPGNKGVALVTATDRTSAALGAAIAGSAKVTVTVPTIKAIEIRPADTKIAAGEKRTFHATRVYSDGTTVPLGRGVVWSASDKIYIDENGSARTSGIGAATITALDKGSGVKGELKLTVEGQRSKETPFGTFTYVADQEAVVMPLLNKAVKTFGDAESLDEKLDALDINLSAAADKIPPLKDVVADVQKRTDRTTKIEANAARGAEKDLKLLTHMLEALQKDAKTAAENLTITKDDLEGAQDMARADSLMKEAQKHQSGMQTFVRTVSIGIDMAFKVSKGDPSAIKPAWDAAGLVVGIFAESVNPWLKEAQALQERAKNLFLVNAGKKLALAAQHAKAVQTQMNKLGPELEGFKADDERNWKTAEKNFDATPGGIFKFEDVKAALALAQQEVDLARKSTETAYGAREAAKALARPSVAPSDWMANPKEDQKIIKALLQGTTAMFQSGIDKRKRAETLLKRFQETHGAARKGMYSS
jgi:hypothetical protein